MAKNERVPSARGRRALLLPTRLLARSLATPRVR